MKVIEDYTEDGLKLTGYLYESRLSEACVVFIHGMNGNLEHNHFANIWGNILSNHGISFLFGYTRGHSKENHILTKNGGSIQCGTTYEVFEDSFYDVDLWVTTAKKLGYTKIILLGHSLGCNKVIHYLYRKGNVVDGLILASPPDMIGLIKSDVYQKNYKELIREAEQNIKNGKPDQILSSKLWEEYFISSKTFLSYTNEQGEINNLPVSQNPEHFKQLETIEIPILAFMGSEDDITIRSIPEDLELIKRKASSCPNFETKIFQNANHLYETCEEYIGNDLIEWIKKTIS
ncbi:MAG: alpha/beta fold hydrolase [Bacilli bacterium]|nr:alpha/beta fold hydrolase [Bacilli bacterium]